MKRTNRRLTKQGRLPAEQADSDWGAQPPTVEVAPVADNSEPAHRPSATQQERPPAIHPDPVELAAARRWHYPIIAAIPAVLTALNPNWMFQNGVHMDPWSYFGHFQHFPRFHNLVWNYMGERIAWIAPGYLLSHLFGHTTGVIVLHLLMYWLCLFTLHFVVTRLADGRTAFLSTILFGCNSFFIGTNSWDYPESLAILFVLLSFASVLRANPNDSAKPLIASGMAWMALAYTYLAWIAFTPAYLYAVSRLVQGNRQFAKTLMRVGIFVAIGSCITTGLFWATFAVMGGKGFFFKNNIIQAIYLAKLQNNPWIEADWYRKCTWLVFPILSFCLTAVFLLAKRFSARVDLGHGRQVLWFYFYSFLVMVIYTIRENRLLAIDYRASILLPGVFLVLALLVFKMPERLSQPVFYFVSGIAAFLSVAPLGSLYLHFLAPGWAFVVPAAIVLFVLVSLRMLRGSTAWSWAASVMLFSGISFAIVPPSKAMAWRSVRRDYDMSERVSRAARVIADRLPQQSYPNIWTNISDSRLGPEFQAIMCALIVQSESMWHFPKADRVFPVGSRIFVLTEHRDIVAAASYILARQKMPSRLVSQDAIDHRGVSYWITQFEVIPAEPANLRSGFILQSEFAFSPASVLSTDGQGANPLVHNKRLVMAEPGIYQFEVRTRAPMDIAIFGGLAADGKWVEQSGPPVQDGSDSIRWFRLALETGEAIDLALQRTAPSLAAGLPAQMPKLSILKDGSVEHSTAAFDYFCPRILQTARLIENGGFEGGLTRWGGYEGSLQLSTDCHRGLCVEFAGLEGSRSYIAEWQVAKLEMGHTYQFSAWLRSKSPAPQNVALGVWDQDVSQWVSRTEVALPAVWTRFQQRFTNTSPNRLAIQFVKTSRAAGTFMVDDVSVEETHEPN